MEQLILRQAAIDALRTCYDTETITMDNGDEYINYCDAVGEIEQLPPIQPEIVRCKDCKYAEYIDDVKTLWCTECGQGRTVAQYDFCSYAERRWVTT